MLQTDPVTDDPVAVLWHYLNGRMCDWTNGNDGPVSWCCRSHRGVQWLDRVQFPRKQKRYIFAEEFQIRYNERFEEVIRECSDISREGKTWIVEPYIRGMIQLNKMGFAHSWECWMDGKLVGGCFGMQMGRIMTCDSMFHRASNASKAAYGQTLVRLQQKGFLVVDTNGVAKHKVNYGEEWVRQWEFEKIVRQHGFTPTPFLDDRPAPAYPPEIKAMWALKNAARLAAAPLRIIKHKLRPPAASAPAMPPGSQDPNPGQQDPFLSQSQESSEPKQTPDRAQSA